MTGNPSVWVGVALDQTNRKNRTPAAGEVWTAGVFMPWLSLSLYFA